MSLPFGLRELHFQRFSVTRCTEAVWDMGVVRVKRVISDSHQALTAPTASMQWNNCDVHGL